MEEDANIVNTVGLIDIVSGEWLTNPCQPAMIKARSSHSSCATRNRALVFGGYDRSAMSCIDSVEISEIKMTG